MSGWYYIVKHYTWEYIKIWFKIYPRCTKSGNSEHKHFKFILAFDYILVIIRNDASYIT